MRRHGTLEKIINTSSHELGAMLPRMHTPTLRHALLVLPLLFACGATAPNVVPDAPAPNGELDPGAAAEVPERTLSRISSDVRPKRYDLTLRIDPAVGPYSGSVQIELHVPKALDSLELHAFKLDITTATLRGAHGTTVLSPKRTSTHTVELVGDVPAGDHTLTMAFTGTVPTTTAGMYRVEVDGVWYIFTQFEPLEARKAFPCFDQPEFKSPFTVHLEVPSSQQAFSNAPLASTEALDDGWTRHHFKPTQPLPTYLVALAVGEFDVVEGAPGATPIPFRIITRRGKGGETAFVIEQTPKILRWLSNWFGSSYPFQKLDMIAVPNFAAGAMENAGLVTYRESLLLFDVDTAPITTRLWSQIVIAHELAHMWFGDLVTMAWWDDLWLNEAFATWMASACIKEIDPELELPLQVVTSKAWVMGLDAQAEARAIRQPIESDGDIYNAFDGITYTKGASVLWMVQSWLGEEVFRKGIRAYLAAHRFGNATTADLMNALDSTSGEPVSQVFDRFLVQPGTPLIDIALRCNGDAAATVTLKQTRYRPMGSTAALGEPWTLPVCLRYGSGGNVTRHCVVVSEATQDVELPTAGCPEWLAPNDDEQGYYRWRLSEKLLQAWIDPAHPERLLLPEKVALLGHLGSLLEAGELEVSAFANVLSSLAAEPNQHREVLKHITRGYGFIDRLLTSEPAKAALAARANKALTPHLTGLDIRSDANLRERRVRPSLVKALGTLGRDRVVAKRARKTADAFLDSVEAGTWSAPGAVVPQEVVVYLPLAAKLTGAGDDAYHDVLQRRIAGALKTVDNSVLRRALINAAGSFKQPPLVRRSLDLLLDGTLRSQDYRTLVRGLSDDHPVVHASFSWLKDNFDRIVALLGVKSAPYLPFIADGYCTSADSEAVQRFFDSKRDIIPSGLERNLALTRERIALCSRLRQAHGPAMKSWLGIQ